MRRFYPLLTRWLLLTVFAAIAVIGEGLHLVPGFGHYQTLPGGDLLPIGVRVVAMDGRAERSESRFRAPQPAGAPIMEAGFCPICAGLAEVQDAVHVVEVQQTSDVPERTGIVSINVESHDAFDLWAARAPPII